MKFSKRSFIGLRKNLIKVGRFVLAAWDFIAQKHYKKTMTISLIIFWSLAYLIAFEQ